MIYGKLILYLVNVNFFDGSVGVRKELLRQINLRNVSYINDELKIEFIDFSKKF